MTTYEELQQYAHDKGIKLVRPVPGLRAVAYRYRGRAIIAMEDNPEDPDSVRATTLAHEIGHIEEDALEGPYSGRSSRARNEQRAWRSAILRCVPRSMLDAAIIRHQGDLWAVAEDLGVTKQLIDRAIAYYETQGV